MNILIYENKRSRINILKKALSGLTNTNHRIIFVENKLIFLYLSKQAHVIFSYSLSKYTDTSNLRLLYIGQVGNRLTDADAPYSIVSAPNFVSNHIADYVLAAVLAYERKLLQNAFSHNNIKWNQEAYLNPLPRSFNKLKIGVLGLGRVGSEVARAFIKIGCEVKYCDKDVLNKVTPENFVQMVKCEDLLSFADYLILAVNDENNTGLIDHSWFEKMNSDLCLVNISRASVINEVALLQALGEKKIRGAILDVFNNEPLKKSSIYRKFNSVVITPHIAGNIDLVFDQIADHFVTEINNRLHV